MVARPIETQPETMVDTFWRWSERFKDAITVDAKGLVILCPPV
jgi:hypothetical protein